MFPKKGVVETIKDYVFTNDSGLQTTSNINIVLSNQIVGVYAKVEKKTFL